MKKLLSFIFRPFGNGDDICISRRDDLTRFGYDNDRKIPVELGVKLIGTNAEAIDKAEDRDLFKKTMKKIGQPVIPSDIATDIDYALEVADRIGYPVIIRPAFTLGGAGGGVAYTKDEFIKIASNGLMLSPISQILVETRL